MQLEGKKGWGVVWDFLFQFKIYNTLLDLIEFKFVKI